MTGTAIDDIADGILGGSSSPAHSQSIWSKLCKYYAQPNETFPLAQEWSKIGCADKPHNTTETPPLTREASKQLINDPSTPIDGRFHIPQSSADVL